MPSSRQEMPLSPTKPRDRSATAILTTQYGVTSAFEKEVHLKLDYWYAVHGTSLEDSNNGTRTVQDSTVLWAPNRDSANRAGGASGMVFRAAFWAADGSEEPCILRSTYVHTLHT